MISLLSQITSMRNDPYQTLENPSSIPANPHCVTERSERGSIAMTDLTTGCGSGAGNFASQARAVRFHGQYHNDNGTNSRAKRGIRGLIGQTPRQAVTKTTADGCLHALARNAWERPVGIDGWGIVWNFCSGIEKIVLKIQAPTFWWLRSPHLFEPHT